MGFDAHQPLRLLFDQLQPELALQELDPAMTVWLDGQPILRPKDREAWLQIAEQSFEQPAQQRKFWQHLLRLNDFVWQASARNRRFPPQGLGDLLTLAVSNPPQDLPKPLWAFVSIERMLRFYGLAGDERFRRFLNEQLLITAQSFVEQTPFLFGAPALCYTNASNYYIPGGMIRLPFALMAKLGQFGGDLRLRHRVDRIERQGAGYTVTDHKGRTYQAQNVLANVPVWNLPAITTGEEHAYFAQAAEQQDEYWGAVTMGIAIRDTLPEDTTLHHQLILPPGERLPLTGGTSVFVSLSAPGDRERAPAGERVLSVSTHAHNPAWWHQLPKDDYRAAKQEIEAAILNVLERYLPGFHREQITHKLTSTPRSWANWIRRYQGSVGGVPQNIHRSLFQWQGALTPFPHFFVCGDTVYPGQGIPGVSLGGQLAAERIQRRVG
jgi:phytoene dehydrogenase-like protein